MSEGRGARVASEGRATSAQKFVARLYRGVVVTLFHPAVLLREVRAARGQKKEMTQTTGRRCRAADRLIEIRVALSRPERCGRLARLNKKRTDDTETRATLRRRQRVERSARGAENRRRMTSTSDRRERHPWPLATRRAVDAPRRDSCACVVCERATVKGAVSWWKGLLCSGRPRWMPRQRTRTSCGTRAEPDTP